MTPVADRRHNVSYLVECPHPDECEFGCAPINGMHLITQSQWEFIKNDDVAREKFKKLSAVKFGKIKTVVDV
ncbi:MAG: hypothetical protein IIB40_05005 [Candidatus Marinimicrobia bacterium]|nr:hypothetical protein [Candidatus Neomarinimicrobiota bacterium]